MKTLEALKRSLVILPLYLWQIIFLIIPSSLLIAYGLFSKQPSLSIFKFIIESGFIKMLFRSLFYSTTSSFISLIIGYIVVYSIFRTEKIYRFICLALLAIPFLTNFLIHMMGWLSILKPNSFINKIFYKLNILTYGSSILYTNKAIILGYVYCYIPFLILPIYISFYKMNMNILKASYDLGASRIQTLFKILIPITKPAIKNGFFLIFIPSFGEFVIPEILGGDYHMVSGTALSFILLNVSLIHNASLMTIIFILFLSISSIILNFIIEKLIYLMEKI